MEVIASVWLSETSCARLSINVWEEERSGTYKLSLSQPVVIYDDLV